MWWQVGRLMLAVLVGQVVLGAVAGASATPAKADPAADARTLYCLEPENTRPLVEAAVTLGTARAGRDAEHLVPLSGGAGLTAAQWSRRDPAAFQRTCAALAAERRLPEPDAPAPKWVVDLVTAMVGVIAVVLGAVLTLGSTLFLNRRTAAMRAAGDLHAAAGAHYRACRACLDGWRDLKGGTLEGAMDAPLEVFTAELRRIAGRHPTWRRPASIGDAAKELDRDIREFAWPAGRTERGERVTAFQRRLDEVNGRALEIAATLERPWPGRSRRMRRP
ncbi:hypothetical protein GCM10022254_15630 [Actinomadura meridiana]|uniref:DUF5129 domain-containing protein n=1 Tax=Actinomadura meridiana TaxID=559626 RepID=A0ABP8BVK2_9ACTN